MKKLIPSIAMAGIMMIGCAHKEKNMGGSSDQSTSSYSKSATYDTNSGNLNNPVNNNTDSNVNINSNP